MEGVLCRGECVEGVVCICGCVKVEVVVFRGVWCVDGVVCGGCYVWRV